MYLAYKINVLKFIYFLLKDFAYKFGVSGISYFEPRKSKETSSTLLWNVLLLACRTTALYVQYTGNQERCRTSLNTRLFLVYVLFVVIKTVLKQAVHKFEFKADRYLFQAENLN